MGKSIGANIHHTHGAFGSSWMLMLRWQVKNQGYILPCCPTTLGAGPGEGLGLSGKKKSHYPRYSMYDNDIIFTSTYLYNELK